MSWSAPLLQLHQQAENEPGPPGNSPLRWRVSEEQRMQTAFSTLIGAPLRHGEQDPLAVQHIVHSFDPCLVCTLH